MGESKSYDIGGEEEQKTGSNEENDVPKTSFVLEGAHHSPIEIRDQRNRDVRSKKTADNSSDDSPTYSRCVALNECMKCSSDEMDPELVNVNKDPIGIACAATGRRQHFDCVLEHSDGTIGDDGVNISTTDKQKLEEVVSNNDDATSGHRHVRVWKSCISTPRDDFVKVVWMQILCLIVGIMSCKIVSRQKRKHASLFDQRRYNAIQQRRQPTQQQPPPKPPSAPASSPTRPVKRNASDTVTSNQKEGTTESATSDKETEMTSLLSPLSIKDPK